MEGRRKEGRNEGREGRIWKGMKGEGGGREGGQERGRKEGSEIPPLSLELKIKLWGLDIIHVSQGSPSSL